MKSEAKMSMLKDLRKMANSMMGDDLKGKMDSMKKVTVAAKDKEGLEKGLDKAKDIVSEEPEMVEDMEEAMQEDLDNDNEDGEDTEHVEKVMGEDSPEALKAKIEELQKKLSSLK